MSKITIDDAQAKRRELEQRMAAELEAFTGQTGLRVTSVGIGSVEVTQMQHAHREYGGYQVMVRVDLDP